MVKEFRFGRMAQYMKVGGKIMWLMVKEDLYMQMETSIMDIGSTINHKVTVLIKIMMVLATKAIGLKISSKGKEKNNGKMDLILKDNIIKEKNKEKVNSFLRMVVNMKENSLKIKLKEEENIFGMIIDNLKDNGLIIKWKVMEYILGLMDEDMKEIMLKIKNLVKVFFTGQMEEIIMVNGKMENNMD
jgi:hypothetical protein